MLKAKRAFKEFRWAINYLKTKEGNNLSDEKETKVDANSREFSRGVEAGMHAKDTKYWQAGYELGQELSVKGKDLVNENIPPEPESPLFLRGTLDSHKGDAQDEKDKSAE
jgi:hypothetical protein